MSRFHVGQRVQKVGWRRAADRHDEKYAYRGQLKLGALGVIVGPSTSWRGEWLVKYEGHEPVSQTPYMIHPIRDDDSQQVVSWSQCVWKPKHIGVPS